LREDSSYINLTDSNVYKVPGLKKKKKNLYQGWKSSSNGRVPAKQTQSLSLKTPVPPNKEKKTPLPAVIQVEEAPGGGNIQCHRPNNCSQWTVQAVVLRKVTHSQSQVLSQDGRNYCLSFYWCFVQSAFQTL
jgi:hypothetical protein